MPRWPYFNSIFIYFGIIDLFHSSSIISSIVKYTDNQAKRIFIVLVGGSLPPLSALPRGFFAGASAPFSSSTAGVGDLPAQRRNAIATPRRRDLRFDLRTVLLSK